MLNVSDQIQQAEFSYIMNVKYFMYKFFLVVKENAPFSLHYYFFRLISLSKAVIDRAKSSDTHGSFVFFSIPAIIILHSFNKKEHYLNHMVFLNTIYHYESENKTAPFSKNQWTIHRT